MTIKRGINKLGFNSYARGKKHLLTEKMKEIRFHWCKLILNLLKSNSSKIKFFSYEKILLLIGPQIEEMTIRLHLQGGISCNVNKKILQK